MVVVDEEQFRSLLATIAVARAYHAQSLGDVPGTVKHAQRVLELLPEGDHLRREQATALLGLTYWASGDLEAADRVFADYSMRLRAAGNIPDAIGAASVLADIRMALGRLREAVGALEQLLQFVVDQGEPLPPDAADLYRGLGELYLERGDLDAAARTPAEKQGTGRASRAAGMAVSLVRRAGSTQARHRATWRALSACWTRLSACSSGRPCRTCVP